MVALQLATHDAAQLQMADIVIHPHVDGIGLITTKPRDGETGNPRWRTGGLECYSLHQSQARAS